MASERPPRKTKSIQNGDTVFEAGDCRFVSSPAGTVHERDPADSDEYDFVYHPRCGQRLPHDSLWGRVDADSPAEAVVKFDLRPCTRCFDRPAHLRQLRRKARRMRNSIDDRDPVAVLVEDDPEIRTDGGTDEDLLAALTDVTEGDHQTLVLDSGPVEVFVADISTDLDGLAGVAKQTVTFVSLTDEESVSVVIEHTSRGETSLVYATHTGPDGQPEYATIEAIEESDQQPLVADGGTTTTTGPHECPYDEDYEWWCSDGEMFVRGHHIEATCCDCEDGSLDDLVEGQQFMFSCSCASETHTFDGRECDFTHTLSVCPAGHPAEWAVFGTGGVDATLRLEDDHATVTYEYEDETRTWRLDSETLFDDEGSQPRTDGAGTDTRATHCQSTVGPDDPRSPEARLRAITEQAGLASDRLAGRGQHAESDLAAFIAALADALGRHLRTACLSPCADCGRPQTEHAYGKHRCWYCERRAAGPDGPPAENPGVSVPDIEHEAVQWQLCERVLPGRPDGIPRDQEGQR